MKHSRFICAVCAAVMLTGSLTVFPAEITAYAETEPFYICSSGNFEWDFYRDGTLVISGKGRMDDNEETPFENYNRNSGDTITLKKVIFEEGITHIGADLFYSGEDQEPEGDCKDLTSVTLPDSLESIGAGAFESCRKLKEINIPERVQHFGYMAFAGTPWYDDLKAQNEFVILNNVLLEAPASETLTVPDGVTRIAMRVVWSDEVRRVVLPDSVTVLEEKAFADCINLEEIVIPESVSEIGISAFAGTKWLADRCAENPCVTVNHILVDCYAVEGELVIPDDVEIIPTLACAKYEGITGVVIPETVKKIGAGAFMQCSSLKSISFPDHLAAIPPYICTECTALSDIRFPAHVREIGQAAFGGCSGLTEITLPETVTWVGYAAFTECSSVKEITVLNPYCRFVNFGLSFCNHFIFDFDNEIPVKDRYAGTVRGYSSSTAEEAAIEADYPFVSLGEIPDQAFVQPLVRGDVDRSDKVDVADAVLLARFLTEDAEAIVTQEGLICADTDRSGSIDLEDLTYILQKIAKRPVNDEIWNERTGNPFLDYFL